MIMTPAGLLRRQANHGGLLAAQHDRLPLGVLHRRGTDMKFFAQE
jgi:hypothetical protein